MILPRTDRAAAQQAIPLKTVRPILEELEQRLVLSTSIPLNTSSWVDVGPAPIDQPPAFQGSGAGFGPVSGRVTGLATDPTNASIIYAATAGGGVWKTTDGGTNWSPLTDHLTDSSGNPIVEFMGAIAIAPSNPSVLYAGTGEANNSIDSYYGEGVLVSTDGGANWTLTGQSQFTGLAISQIVVDPLAPNIAYAAVSNRASNGTSGSTGIYKTANGGTSWTNVTAADGQDSTDPYSAVVIDPTTTGNTAVLFAAIGNISGAAGNGVIESKDGGSTWTAVAGVTGGTSAGRISLAISHPSTQADATLYASIEDPTTGGLLALEKSSDSGNNWTTLSVPDYLGGSNSNGGQGWYDNVVLADPNNPNNVYVAGVITYATGSNAILESTNGGTSWTDLTVGTAGGNGPHTDHHALALDASGKLVDGNDGGVWRLDTNTSSTTAWTDINGNLETIQFTGVALDPTNLDVAYGGSQDNGTEKFTDSRTWSVIAGGDGGFVRVDPTNTQIVFHTFNGDKPGFIERSNNGGSSWTDISGGINGSDPSNFYVPYIIDPTNHNRLLLGTNKLYVTTDQGGNAGGDWVLLSASLPSTAKIDAIAIGPNNGNDIFYSAGGGLFVSTNNGTSWSTITPTGVTGRIKSIWVDGTDTTGNTVYVTSNNRSGNGHVFMTTNALSATPTWTDITGDLPNFPANSVVLTQNPDQIVVGTDVGVYATAQANGLATHWTRLGTGLPDAQVVELQYDPVHQVLAAGTHGRGLWEIEIAPSVKVTFVTPPTGPTEGTSTGNVTVATFVTNESNPVPADFSAVISWGDGQTSTVTGSGIVQTGPGSFEVVAAHSYLEEGTNLPFSVTVTNDTGASDSGTATVATVNDAALTVTGVAISATEGQGVTGALVATFSDADGTNTSSDPVSDPTEYSATIDWSDGLGNSGTTTGTIVYSGTDRTFNVYGTSPFSFPEEGNLTATVHVADIGNPAYTVTAAVTVADAPLTGTGTTLTATEGDTLGTVTVATFTDTDSTNTSTDPQGTASDYTATVTVQGYAGPITTHIVPTGGNNFAVTADLTSQFTEEGTYAVTATISETVGTASVTVTGSIAVADAPLTATAPTTGVTVAEGTAPGAMQVATFTDTDPTAEASTNYTATITWDDGGTTHTSTGTIVPTGVNTFAVFGTDSVPISEDGTHTVTVVIQDVGGATATVTTSFSATEGPISASGTTFVAVEGQAYSGGIGTFYDPDSPETAFNQNFNSVTIDWGDGQSSNGVVVPLGSGNFSVQGTHTYLEEGSYGVSFTVLDAGNASSATAVSSVGVVDASLAGISMTVPSDVLGGQVLVNYPVAVFADQNVYSSAGELYVTISWGDGGASQGVVVPNGSGTFTVLGTHTYLVSGPLQLTVSVQDDGGASISGAETVYPSVPAYVGSTLGPAPLGGAWAAGFGLVA